MVKLITLPIEHHLAGGGGLSLEKRLAIPRSGARHHTIYGVQLRAKADTAAQGHRHRNAISCSIKLTQPPNGPVSPAMTSPRATQH